MVRLRPVNKKYYNRLFNDLKWTIQHGKSYLGKNYALILQSQHWNSADLEAIMRLIADGYQNEDNKIRLSDFISRLSVNPDFKLYELNSDLYWEYLIYNRTIILDPSTSRESKNECFSNIVYSCPPMALSLMCGIDQTSEFQRKNLASSQFSGEFFLLQSYNEGYEYKNTRLDYSLWSIDLSMFPNGWDWNLTDLNKYLKNQYVRFKDEMDYWINNNFEKFRNDKAAFKEYMTKKQL